MFKVFAKKDEMVITGEYLEATSTKQKIKYIGQLENHKKLNRSSQDSSIYDFPTFLCFLNKKAYDVRTKEVKCNLKIVGFTNE